MAEHTPIAVYEMPDESQEALLRRIESGTAVLAFNVCAACAPGDVLERIDDGDLDLCDGDALAAQWPCRFATRTPTPPAPESATPFPIVAEAPGMATMSDSPESATEASACVEGEGS